MNEQKETCDLEKLYEIVNKKNNITRYEQIKPIVKKNAKSKGVITRNSNNKFKKPTQNIFNYKQIKRKTSNILTYKQLNSITKIPLYNPCYFLNKEIYKFLSFDYITKQNNIFKNIYLHFSPKIIKRKICPILYKKKTYLITDINLLGANFVQEKKYFSKPPLLFYQINQNQNQNPMVLSPSPIIIDNTNNIDNSYNNINNSINDNNEFLYIFKEKNSKNQIDFPLVIFTFEIQGKYKIKLNEYFKIFLHILIYYKSEIDSKILSKKNSNSNSTEIYKINKDYDNSIEFITFFFTISSL